MKNYYLNEETELFIKCSEKCSECKNGIDICSECNNEKGFYKVEGKEGECWKNPPEENWAYDDEAKEWRKCNERCKKCKIQSKLESDHQCLECADNYYSYYIDYLNFEKGIYKALNCYTNEEVKIENENYFLNGNYFEQCDKSCAQCENTKNNCLKCQMNHYNIKGFKNGTCYQFPLENNCLIQIDGETVFSPCFHLCKFCNQATQSFLYQQCSQCDEINYTLDLFSLNKSYCIPKIKKKNNTYLIKDEQKWYIEDFEGMDNFIIENKLLEIDYQRLLNNEKFKNLKYEVVDECPSDKPYIIYTTRQCVSSCSSSNLIEFGIFMTEKLYLYNHICYNECPYGSINDNITFTCKERNEYTKTNISLTRDLYDKTQEDYRK